jgi:DNA primase
VKSLSEKLKLLKSALGTCWSNETEHLFHCPKCKHHKRKLSVNVEKGVFKCWICDYSGTKVSQLIRKHAPSYYADYRRLEGEVDLTKYDTIFSNNIVSSRQIVDLPENFQTLTGQKSKTKTKALNYLYNRGFTDEDILTWKMGFCNYGEYQDRIIIPSFDDEANVNFFVARSYVGAWMKYQNPHVSKDIIFNDLNIDWERDIILTEGVFDAVKCPNSIPLLGSTLRENSLLFQKICEFKPDIYLGLDEDVKEKEFKIAKKLREYGIRVLSIDVTGYADIGEMPVEIVEERKQNADIVSDLDYLHYKLDF